MSVAALVSGPCGGGSADAVAVSAGEGAALPLRGKAGRTGFDFALEPSQQASLSGQSDARLDHLIDELHRHSNDPAALRRAAGAISHTVETSLWQSAHRQGSRLPMIHAELLGKAAGLFVVRKLHGIAATAREWLVLLSSPRRILWAVKAAWHGDDVAGYVRERAGWHSVEEIAVFQRDREAPLVRVGNAVPADEDDWLASNPVFGISRRQLASMRRVDDACEVPPAEEEPAHAIAVIGEKCEITARVTGHAPPRLKSELQSLCGAADEILGDKEAGRAEWVFRLKRLVTPALKKTGPHIAEKFWNPFAILTVFLVAGAGLLSSAGVEHLRWEGIVKQLDSEPGIEIMSHSMTWGRREMEVLRDPQARPVRDLLRQFGIEPASVAIRERPVLSADAPMVVARQQSQVIYARQLAEQTMGAKERVPSPASKAADPSANPAGMRADVLAAVRLDLLRTVLDLPGDLDLSLSGGELTARGVLSEPSYSSLAHASRKLGWLKKIHLDQVRDLTGENITELQRGLEKTHIEFVPASAILPEASKLRLQSVASEMNLLASDARLKRTSVHVQFCASHPAMDTATIDHRVDTIRRDLERLGVPAAWFYPPMDLLDAPGPHVMAFRLNLEPPSPEP